MQERQLTEQQMREIEEIKKQWLAEAEPYLNAPVRQGAVLDGSNTTALAQIQIKYLPRIRKILGASE